MKRTLIIGALSLMGVIARAEVILTEDFDYQIGKELTQCGMWYVEYAGDNKPEISNGLEFSNYPQSGIGNGALINTDGSNGMPHLNFGQTISTGNVYVAMMLQAFVPASKSGWFFSLRDSHVWEQTYNENGRLLLNDANQLGLAVAKPSGVCGYSTKVLDTQKVYLVVLKYAIKAGKNNDQVSLYVLDSIVNTEPTTPDVGPLSDSGVADINPANLLLRGFDADAWIFLDGIRVATTWEDALGVEPLNLPVIGDRSAVIGVRKYIENGRMIIEHNGVKNSVLGNQM